MSMTVVRRALLASSLAALAVLPACNRAQPPAAPVRPPPSSVSGQSSTDCVGAFTAEGAASEQQIAGKNYRRQGAVLSVAAADADDGITLGVLANLKEATPENLYNLKRYLKFFADEKVEAVLVAGDTAEVESELRKLVESIADSGLPVLIIPGSREKRAYYRSVMDSVTARRSNVIDMTRVRLANLDDVSVVSLPGYYNPRFLRFEGEGCQYFTEDVDALAPAIKAARGPVLLLSHAEPLGSGPKAVDAFPDGNAGDAHLAQFLKAQKVPFGVVANMHEAAGHATDLASQPVAPGAAAPELYLNAGPADATGYRLSDGSTTFGMAGLVTVRGGKASYRFFQAGRLTEAQRVEIAGAPRGSDADVATATGAATGTATGTAAD